MFSKSGFAFAQNYKKFHLKSRIIICAEKLIFTAQKQKNISTQPKHIKNLNFLFYKEGFSFWVKDSEGKINKVSHIKVTNFNRWEVEIVKELEINLRLRRNFDQVKVAFISSFFNLVPDVYSKEIPEVLLNFSEAEFEDNQLLTSASEDGFSFVYGTSSVLINKLKELFGKVEFFHSGLIFLNSIEKTKEISVHLNLNHHQLEIVVISNFNVQFYNLFETPSGEDILFFTLFSLEQLGLDSNKIEIKTYGELLPKTKVFQILRKHVRYVNAALKDEDFLENYTLYKLSKCELFQGNSEEKG